MEDGAPIRILLAGQHALLRDSIRSALESEPHIHVVAESRPGPQAVTEADRVRPDLAILEVGQSRIDRIRVITALRERVPECHILLLSDGEDLKILIEGLELGIGGYVSKESPLAELVEAVRTVSRGDPVIPRRLLGSLITTLVQRRKEQDESFERVSRLSPREREVLKLLAEGADNAMIGRRLVISPQTARTHIQNILSKLGAHSRLGAVAIARGSGIFDELPSEGWDDDQLEMTSVSG